MNRASPAGRDALLAGAAALVAFVAYLPSFGGVFQFDDYNVIVNYPTVHSWRALLERAGQGVRPLLKASYALNWSLGPGELGFHLLNNAAHALNAALLYLVGAALCERWFATPPGTRAPMRAAVLVAALLFALHPAQTEAVTYISGRSSSLMAVCYLGALLAYLRGASWRVTALLFVLAVAIRETAVTLPAALLLCELTRGERPSFRTLARRQGVHWLLLGAGALFVLLNERYFAHIAFGFTRRGMAENLIAQVGGVSYLVSRLLALAGYNIDPALPAQLDWDPVLGMQAGLLAALALLGLASLRSRPWIAFGIGWFFLQLVPTNSIVPRLDVANDRQLYLACWGLFLALAIQVARLGWRRSLNAGVAGALLSACAASSVSRQLDYASEIALWEASVAASPWNARAHNNLGYAYQLAGRRDDAQREYERALLFDPANAKARLNLRFLR
jgi:tetratricopeptide (TPR) repeat protein